MGSLIKNIITIGGLAAIALAGYYLFIASDDTELSTNNAFVVGQAEIENQEFLRRLAELETMSLPASVFTDPRFDSFVIHTEPIEEVPFGRENPFEPF